VNGRPPRRRAKILKGTRPVDVRNESVINLKIAKPLGLNIPAAVFARADDVIE
jgi:ABC-type uncharacterized transport system substrate-binding protein